jgi:uncharacterized protein (UPF0297 family)
LNEGEGVALNSAEFNKSMEIIVEALKERGYDPYAQLYGYLKENNPMYITQHKNARELIMQLDVKQIQRFINSM